MPPVADAQVEALLVQASSARLTDEALLSLGRQLMHKDGRRAIVVLVNDVETRTLRALCEGTAGGGYSSSSVPTLPQTAAAAALVPVAATAVSAASQLVSQWEQFAESMSTVREELRAAAADRLALEAQCAALERALGEVTEAKEDAVAHADAIASRCAALEDSVRRAIAEKDAAGAAAASARAEAEAAGEDARLALEHGTEVAGREVRDAQRKAAQDIEDATAVLKGMMKGKEDEWARERAALTATNASWETRAAAAAVVLGETNALLSRTEQRLQEATRDADEGRGRLRKADAEFSAAAAASALALAERDASIADLQAALAALEARLVRERAARDTQVEALNREWQRKLDVVNADRLAAVAAAEAAGAARLAESRAAAASERAALQAEVDGVHKALEDFTHNTTNNFAELAMAKQLAAQEGAAAVLETRAACEKDKDAALARLRAELDAIRHAEVTEVLTKWDAATQEYHDSLEHRDDEISRLRDNLSSVGEVLKNEVEKGSLLEKDLEASRRGAATLRRQMLTPTGGAGGATTLTTTTVREEELVGAPGPTSPVSPSGVNVKARAGLFATLAIASAGRSKAAKALEGSA